MFRRTHIRLTILNSLVFIVLIGIFGSLIYGYTRYLLYRDVDVSLNQAVTLTQNEDQDYDEFYFAKDPRVSVLFWNASLEQFVKNPEAKRFLKYKDMFKPRKLNVIHDIDVQNYTFRTIAKKVNTSYGTVIIQAIRNVNSEKELLNHLLTILIIGCGLGSICAIAGGYFLAGRALVPIEKAWRKQQQFVSDASHELRTPLAVIQSKTDVLFRTPAATIEEKAMDISIISKECRRLSKLVANLLTLARSDSNQLELKKATFQLDRLLKEIIDHYAEIAEYQGKTITLDAASTIFFHGDIERIHQLIIILLDNAMKYTGEGGKIHLSCYQTASSIMILIKDNGIGIPESDVPKIFDRFYQSDKVRSTSEGAGLGLSIAKWIVDKHQGKIKVESKIDAGTSFEIVLPVKG